MTTVLVADDQELVRAGLRTVLEHQEGIAVVGEAADGRQAIDRARRLDPDVVLMDIRMPVVDGIAATRELTAAADGRPRVLMLTTFDLDEYVLGAIRAGASGFLLKDATPERLANAVRAVAAGDALFAPAVTRRLVERFASTPAGPDAATAARLAELTEREREVLALVARGYSNGEIAELLVLSLPTVKTHVGRVLMKLGLRDRVQVVVLAYEAGIVRAGDPGPPVSSG
jgi:DNA-binding NarL/FixJ family response regulator